VRYYVSAFRLATVASTDSTSSRRHTCATDSVGRCRRNVTETYAYHDRGQTRSYSSDDYLNTENYGWGHVRLNALDISFFFFFNDRFVCHLFDKLSHSSFYPRSRHERKTCFFRVLRPPIFEFFFFFTILLFVVCCRGTPVRGETAIRGTSTRSSSGSRSSCGHCARCLRSNGFRSLIARVHYNVIPLAQCCGPRRHDF
jgi:hypothetical protein